jgi:hypothetical protein
MRKASLRQDQSGIGTVEFALIAPVLLGMLVGIVQLGNLYFANADLRNAVAAGARTAQIFPRPSATVVKDTIKARLQKAKTPVPPEPTVTYVEADANGFPYADIEVVYTVPLNFIIYKPPAVTLRERRRVFIQPA